MNTIHFSKEPGRTRRLEGDEEQRLSRHATTPLIKVLIAAGLETGCRIGELLLLTWADVKWDQHALLLPATITKTNEARDMPLTQNLRALLDMRHYAHDGKEHAADRKQQAAAQKTAAKKKSSRIRTSFAHSVSDSRSREAKTAVEKRSNSLN